ncbi:DUF885 domain-containing protein [Brevundimonas faecalis]|uniref:Uncharacterized protein (DUF885 family) n=1 Tax=Brevundimonas faecalis TaxID=947378 RepID=A0ABV2R7P7_9CAUL
MDKLFLIGVALAAFTAATPALAREATEGAAPARQTQTSTPAAAEVLAQILTDYEAYLRRVDPISSGMDGDRDALSRLPDNSREGELARRAPLTALLTRLDAVDAAALNAEQRLNHDFARYLIRREIERLSLDTSRLAFDSEGGPGQLLSYLAGSTRIAGRADADAWLARLEATPAYYDGAVANARRGLSTGMIQARSVVESALGQAVRDLEAAPADDVLMQPFKTLPSNIPAADQEALRRRALDLIQGPVTARRQAWRAMLQDDYLPKAPVEPGLVHRPGGKDLYAFMVRSDTTTDMTPDQVHEVGRQEVARIRARMQEEMRAAGWTGDFAGFLNFLRTDPQFYATSREQLLEKASEIAKRADDRLPALFGTLPRLPYGVRPVPLEIEATYTTGRYNPGSMKNGVAGGYIVNTGRLDQRPLYELPALTVHEAVPGHHLQIALQQEAADQPYYRRGADVTAFIEGWGLYSEFLGEEMGIYRTPYERFGRLSYEMWRACRLVADTGLHWLGWTEEQARACFRDNSALAPHNIETELQRYIGWPGQATAYKIGEIRLRQIRQKAERELGDRFDVRAFHDALLVDGPLPLGLLDARMDRWIAEQKAR